jgi:SAM-dependent methyltransferase
MNLSIEFISYKFYEIYISLKYSLTEKISGHETYSREVKNKIGIEIGGPSKLFRKNLPLYKKIKYLDGVNFSNRTIWQGDIQSGLSYRYFGNKKGTQFISDGTDLSIIDDQSYDFVLSSNCLEHIANPLKALFEWKRILRDHGVLIIALPNKKSNFDHNRSTTSFDHILEDYENNTSEHDLTHLNEILALHDLTLDKAAGSFENFKARSLENYTNRCLHHHVFDLDLMKSIFDFLQMTVVHQIETRTDFLMLVRK